MKKLDIIFLSSLVTFILFMTLVYSTSQGEELNRRIDIKSAVATFSSTSMQYTLSR